MDDATLTYHVEELELSAGKIRCAVEDRDEAITEALLQGVPASVVASAVGLSRQRVWQIGKAAAPVRLG
jgi:hypothetical protein